MSAAPFQSESVRTPRPKSAEYARRRKALAAQVLKRYREGADLPTIAREMGVTLRRATSLFAFAVSSTPGLSVDQLRGSVEMRLDRLAAETREMANTAEKPSERIAALRELAKIEDQRARLLGLNIRPQDHDRG
jgi:porphobilinogen deaminase